MTQSPAELISAKGVSAIADALNKRPHTIRMWKFRNSLPRSSWPELIAAFPDLTIERLRAIEAKGT